MPRHPLYDLMAIDHSCAGWRLRRRAAVRQRHGSLFHFLAKLIPALPKIGAATPETWTMDHAGAQMGMLNELCARQLCCAEGLDGRV